MMTGESKKDNFYINADAIIDRMVSIYGLSQTKFAKDILGISGTNLSKARKDKKIPEKWFDLVFDKFAVTKSELCGAIRFENDSEDEEIPEDELLVMTKNVLRSNTVYRSALASNIRAFNQAVEDEKEMDDMRKSMERMECGMDEMRDMMRQLLANQSPEKKRVGNDH